MNLELRFDFHAVGQGFFYSGSATYRNYAKFDFVFDCGSEDKDEARREISNYRSEVFAIRKRLNLLVISHFDADHVNLINELLVNGIKVDKLVMPFTLFEERLFLFLENVVNTNGYNAGDELTYRFALDPVGELGNNLDDDSEIYLVENDPDPIPPAGANNIINNDFRGTGNAEQIVIDFPVRTVLLTGKLADTGISGNYKSFLVKDNQKAVVNIGRDILMEFLFYKKSIGAKDKEFFKAVADEFFTASGIDRNAEDLVDQVVSYIARNYRSATPVKELFAAAKKNHKFRQSGRSRFK